MKRITLQLTPIEWVDGSIEGSEFMKAAPGRGLDLLPCPFCGCEEIVYQKYSREVGARWRVICMGCLAMIDPGYAQQPYTLTRMWNRRTNVCTYLTEGGEKQ